MPEEPELAEQQAKEVLPTRPPSWWARALDSFERWLIASGYLDMLAKVVSSTSGLRNLVATASGAAVAHGLVKSALSEFWLGLSVFFLNWALTTFINHVRTKYAKETQKALGQDQDKFIGPESTAAVKDLAKAADANLKEQLGLEPPKA